MYIYERNTWCLGPRRWVLLMLVNDCVKWSVIGIVCYFEEHQWFKGDDIVNGNIVDTRENAKNVNINYDDNNIEDISYQKLEERICHFLFDFRATTPYV